MEFDTKRMSKLAGLPDVDVDVKPVVRGRSSLKQLTESAKQTPAMSADEQKLRSLIRREAQRMPSERVSRSTNPDVTGIQQKRSLTEAIAMGFAGFGFGGKSPVLGSPMTSASRFASLYESENAATNELEEGDASEDEIKKEADDADDAGEDD